MDHLYADGSIPDGYTIDKDGWVFSPKNKPVGGVTVYNGIGKRTGTRSDVYLFKVAFTSKEKLYLTMGHEYVHVYLNYGGTTLDEVAQERVAYKWSMDQANAWNMTKDASHYEKWYNYYLKQETRAPHPYGIPVDYLFKKKNPFKP